MSNFFRPYLNSLVESIYPKKICKEFELFLALYAMHTNVFFLFDRVQYDSNGYINDTNVFRFID